MFDIRKGWFGWKVYETGEFGEECVASFRYWADAHFFVRSHGNGEA
jgi:hypothetical protein